MTGRDPQPCLLVPINDWPRPCLLVPINDWPRPSLDHVFLSSIVEMKLSRRDSRDKVSVFDRAWRRGNPRSSAMSRASRIELDAYFERHGES